MYCVQCAATKDEFSKSTHPTNSFFLFSSGKISGSFKLNLCKSLYWGLLFQLMNHPNWYTSRNSFRISLYLSLDSKKLWCLCCCCGCCCGWCCGCCLLSQDLPLSWELSPHDALTASISAIGIYLFMRLFLDNPENSLIWHRNPR